MADDTMTIRYIDAADLSYEKWQRLTGSTNLYADPAFLSSMAANWAAFVYKDYEAVLPVFPRTKWGIAYLYQPAFIQKTAIHSLAPVDSSLIHLFLSACRNRFRFAEFDLANNPAGNNYYTKQRNNYLVDLRPAYLDIESQYKTDLQKNRKIASQYAFEYRPAENPNSILALYQQTYGKSLSYSNQDYRRLQQYCTSEKGQSQLVIREVRLANEVQAACLCLKDSERLYLLANITVPHARKKAANHFLLDQLIREFAGRLSWLDMEGSDLPGIAHFYQNFGAVNESYYFVAWNDLPFPLQWLKPRY
jgi:hypothetical protein